MYLENRLELQINDDYYPSNLKVTSCYSCYKLLGYDILLDEKLKPHLIGKIFKASTYKKILLEINTIPSLAAKADTIDSYVKNPLVNNSLSLKYF